MSWLSGVPCMVASSHVEPLGQPVLVTYKDKVIHDKTRIAIGGDMAREWDALILGYFGK